MSSQSRIVGLFISSAQSEKMSSVDQVKAIAGRGIVGDRYYLGTGYYSDKKGWGANVTLIESEALHAVNSGYQTNFTGEMLRRNMVTANIRLDSLIGKNFKCGSAVLRGTKKFPPCMHLAHLLKRNDVLKYFAYCGGIGADVVSDGEIKIGDCMYIIEG